MNFQTVLAFTYSVHRYACESGYSGQKNPYCCCNTQYPSHTAFPFRFSIVLLHPALCQDGRFLFRCKVFVRRLPAHGQDLPCLFFSPLDRCQELVDLPAQSLIRAVVQRPPSAVCHQAVQSIGHSDLPGHPALSADEIGKVLCGQRNQVFFSFTAAAVVHTGIAHGVGVHDLMDHLFIF